MLLLLLPFCDIFRVGRGASRNDLGSGTNWPPVKYVAGSSLLLRLPLPALLLLLWLPVAAECFFVVDKDAANSSASFRAVDSD